MKFAKLFTVTCLHQYFGGGPCSDVQIEPTEACQKLLSRFRMLYKQEGNHAISVSRQQPETDDEMQMPTCTANLTFYLFVSNTAFHTYTKSMLQNRNNTLLFTSTKPAANQPDFTVAEKPKFPVSGYFTNRSLFGMLSITPPGTFKNYTLNLEAAAVKWQYYLVSSSGTNLKVITTSPDASFLPIADEDQLQANAVYQALKQARPEATVFLYESDKPLAFAQKPEQKIQLLDINNDTVLIEHLLTPTAEENGLKVIVV